MLVTTALEYLDKLSQDAEDDINLQNDLANAYIGVGKIQYEPSHAHIMLGEVRADQKDFRRAAELYAIAGDAWESLATIDPENVQARMDYGMSLHRLAELQALAGDTSAAIGTFEARFLPMVQKRYKPGHSGLIGYQLEYAALLREARRFEDARRVLDACQSEASGSRLGDVVREQVALYETWGRPELAAAAKARLAQLTAETTQPSR